MQFFKPASILLLASLVASSPVASPEKRMAVGNENIVIGSGHPIDWSRFSQMMGRSEGVELQERGQTADVIKMFGRLINAYTAFKVTNDIANSQKN